MPFSYCARDVLHTGRGAVLPIKPLQLGEIGEAMVPIDNPQWIRATGRLGPMRHGGLLSAVGMSSRLCSRGRM